MTTCQHVLAYGGGGGGGGGGGIALIFKYYDFGTLSSPLKSNWQRVSNQHIWGQPGIQFGWTETSALGVDRGANPATDNLTRDFVGSNKKNHFSAEADNVEYHVNLFFLDTLPHSFKMTIENVPLSIVTEANTPLIKSITVRVTDEMFDMEFPEGSVWFINGVSLDQVQEGVRDDGALSSATNKQKIIDNRARSVISGSRIDYVNILERLVETPTSVMRSRGSFGTGRLISQAIFAVKGLKGQGMFEQHTDLATNAIKKIMIAIIENMLELIQRKIDVIKKIQLLEKTS